MTQYTPRVIDEDDIPPAPSNFVEDLIATVSEPTETTPSNPKDMYRHLLAKAQTRAQVASENAYEACDWFALFDRDTADRYRKSARHLYELSEHLETLIEDS